MKKIIIILFIFHCPFVAICQWYTPTQSYQNLEKYWFYRYRLVNDFMLIGDGPGMSIPAQARVTNLDNRLSDGDSERNTLFWSDATIDLGHYISVLATEWRQLNDQETGQTTF